MFTFNLQLFGGGKKAKTSHTQAYLPDADSKEKALLQNQLNWINNTNSSANQLQQIGDAQLSNQVNPDYNNLYNQYAQQSTVNQDRLNALSNQVDRAGSTNAKANSQYGGLLGSSMSTMNQGSSQLANEYNQAMLQNNQTMQGLTNGDLPSQYAQARQQALQSDLNSTVGNTLSGLASRGIINSSQADSAINDISKNASNTLASQYASDMGMASNIANQNYNNQLQGINQKSNLWNNTYSNNQGGIMNQANLENTSYGNQLSGASALSGLANQSNGLGQDMVNTASTVQSAALQAPQQYYTMAQLNNADNEDLLKTYMQLRYSLAAPAQTTVKQGSGGLFGGFTSGLAGAFCFVAGTPIAYTTGSVNIEDVKTDDEVISLGTVEKVIKLHDMGVKPIYHVETITKAIDTTQSEKFLTIDGLKPLHKLACGDEIMTVNGYERITVIEDTGREEQVYELECTGQNLFYAGGILAEGLTESDKELNQELDQQEGPSEQELDQQEGPSEVAPPKKKRTYTKRISKESEVK